MTSGTWVTHRLHSIERCAITSNANPEAVRYLETIVAQFTNTPWNERTHNGHDRHRTPQIDP